MNKPIPAADAAPFASIADVVRYHQAMASKVERVPSSDVASFLVACHENHDDVDPIAEWLASQFCVDTIQGLTVVSTSLTANRDALRTGDRILSGITEWMLEHQSRRLGQFPFLNVEAIHIDNVVIITQRREFSVIFRK